MRLTRFLRTILPLALVLGTVLAALSAPATVLAGDQRPRQFESGDGWSGQAGWGLGAGMTETPLSSGSYRFETSNSGTGDKYFRFWDSDGTTKFGPSGGSDIQLTLATSTGLQNWGGSKAYYVSVGSTSYKYVFKTAGSGNPGTSKVIVFEIQGTVRSISSTSRSPSGTVCPGKAVTVNATLDGSFFTGQAAWLRYTTDNFSSSTVVKMTGSGTSYSASIPGSANAAGATVRYYLFTSGDVTSISHADTDYYTINLLNNGGSNYSYTVASSWATTTGGNWSTPGTWACGEVPVANQPASIGHSVTMDQNATVSSLEITSGGTYNDSGDANTLTIEGSSSVSPVFRNAGTFTAGNGTIHFKGQSASGNTRNGKVWGPNATAFNNVTISYNGSGNGDADTFGVDFYDQDATAVRATINGELTLNRRTFVANQEQGRNNATSCTARDCGTPTYASGSTLKYNDLEYAETEPGSCPGVPVTNPFQTYSEWLNATSGHGVPNNVTIGSDSWVSLNCNAGTNYRVNGDFTIDAGVDGNTYGGSGTTPAGFEQNGFNLGSISSSALTMAAGKDVVNNGTLKQSGTPVASGTTSFVTIKDDATTPNTLYYGVDIVNGSALGPTTVKISGSQDTCPYVNSGSRPVKRCYYFNVQNAASPQVVFYYEYAELRSGQDPATLNVWKDNGNGTWTKITPSARSACTSGMINCSVTVSSLTEGMGPLMVVGANRYVIMGSDPQAVTLAEFYAAQQGDAVLVTWETASELNNRGFNLYRGTSDTGPDRQLNEALIPSQSQGNPGGFVYTWEDRADLVPGTTYFYWVEDVDIYGTATMHGPVSVDFVVPTAVTLSDVSASPAAGAAVQAAGLLLALLAPLAGAVAVRRRGHG